MLATISLEVRLPIKSSFQFETAHLLGAMVASNYMKMKYLMWSIL